MKKILKGKSMNELIKKVYANEGWVHTVGQNKTKRVLTQYLVDATDNYWVARRKGQYFHLITNEVAPGEKPNWAPQFGDWDKRVVQEESKFTLGAIPAKCKKIVATDGSPEALAAVLADLNK